MSQQAVTEYVCKNDFWNMFVKDNVTCKFSKTNIILSMYVKNVIKWKDSNKYYQICRQHIFLGCGWHGNQGQCQT